MELVEEEYEDSALYEYFEGTRIFFFVWKRDGDVYRVKGCYLWNMSRYDIDVTLRGEWEMYRHIIKYGVKFKKCIDRNGKIRFENNLPNKSETEIIHVRPHSTRAAYRFNNGEEYGNVERDANVLPNVEYMTTQSFWINNDYILKQLREFLNNE